MRLVEQETELTRRQFVKRIGATGVAIFLGDFDFKRKTDFRLPPEDNPKSEIINEYFQAYKSSAEFNIIKYDNGEKLIVPSPAYRSGIYVRDSFYAVLGLVDQRLCSCCYQEFAKAQDPLTGQIPTQVLFDPEDRNERWHDDESTLLFIIWSSVVKKQGCKVDEENVKKAYEFISARVCNYMYFSEKGDFKYWADTYKNPRKQVITYNQGLYACALQALFENDWVDVAFDEVEKAREGYRAVWRQNWPNNYLPQTLAGENMDLSALFGEILSRCLFDEPILSDLVVLQTIDTYLSKALVFNQDADQLHGVKIICQKNGAFLPPGDISIKAFAEPGDYHNGGYWPMWTLVDLALAYKIAPKKEEKEKYREIILKLLEIELRQDMKAKEYLRLCPDPVILGSTEKIRHNYSWNVLFNPIAKWAGLNQ